jgi:hypothetical protein
MNLEKCLVCGEETFPSYIYNNFTYCKVHCQEKIQTHKDFEEYQFLLILRKF